MILDDVYADLIRLVSEIGAQVDVPVESECFFGDWASSFNGTHEEFLRYVKDNLSEWFKCVGSPPEWIQAPEWQFSQGKPMVFVGQVSVSAGTGYFHDEARFYLFWNPENGETKSVIQVA